MNCNSTSQLFIRCTYCTRTLSKDLFDIHIRKGVTVYKKYCRNCITTRNERRSTPEAIAKKQKYDQSPAGKAVQSRANRQPVRAERQRKKRKEDKAFAMRGAMTSKMTRMLRGGAKTSVDVGWYTGFESSEEAMRHFEKHFLPGMTRDNYGSLWHVDHTIPCKWYTSSDEDMFACWSPKNMRPMLGPENKSKGARVPSSIELQSVDQSVFPESWNGQMPDDIRRRVDRMDKHH
mgnify:CR=1 FL=1